QLHRVVGLEGAVGGRALRGVAHDRPRLGQHAVVGHQHRHRAPAAGPPGRNHVDDLDVRLLLVLKPGAPQRPARLLAEVADGDGDQAAHARATSSAGGIAVAGSSMASATRRAEAGPVEIPQGPCPAATKSRPRPGMGPRSGRPSKHCGRAHARTETASPSAGTKARPRSSSAGTNASGSGSRSRKVEPSAPTPPTVVRLNSSGGAAPATADSTPPSSRIA